MKHFRFLKFYIAFWRWSKPSLFKFCYLFIYFFFVFSLLVIRLSFHVFSKASLDINLFFFFFLTLGVEERYIELIVWNLLLFFCKGNHKQRKLNVHKNVHRILVRWSEFKKKKGRNEPKHQSQIKGKEKNAFEKFKFEICTTGFLR